MESRLTEEQKVEIYRYMLWARRFDERYVELYHEGGDVFETPHSHIGEEATMVGACYTLQRHDYVVPSLRTRPALYMRGVSSKELMAGICGKATGPARAKVTTHHMGDNERGIIGTTGIVAGHITASVGVALACKLRRLNSVVMCFFGDGASNRGDFHEALNLAAVKRLPVVFVVENNQYAMWTPISSHMAIENVSDRAKAYGFPGVTVDGMDVMEVYRAVSEAVARAREGFGPTLVECKTYRFLQHAVVPERRSEVEVEEWKKRDPIKMFKKQLMEEDILTPQWAEKLERELKEEIDEAVGFAERSPFPEPEEALRDVYSDKEPLEIKPTGALREMTMGEALNEALREEMARDERVIILGEDLGADAIGRVGGPWPPTKGLCEIYPERVIGTPISESAILGASVGAALIGMRPVAEIMYADFLTIAMDQLVNNAAKMRYNYGGEACVPLVVRTAFGAGSRSALHHSQSAEAWVLNVPGLKIVMPSTPYDAKGLLKASVRDDDPVVFFEHKRLYSTKGMVPEGEYVIPLGRADVKRRGNDVTVVATGRMVHKALTAAEALQKDGVSIEIIDPRTLRPLDEEAIIDSVKKTGRLVTVHEAPRTGGFAGEVAAVVSERALGYLDAPILRVTALDTPVPFSPTLEDFYL
ncbi:MAG: pyruvate dehydrogenase complex E1 component subunit beta, partial [Candidatus Bathyarchaeia archaeon]